MKECLNNAFRYKKGIRPYYDANYKIIVYIAISSSTASEPIPEFHCPIPKWPKKYTEECGFKFRKNPK